MTINMNMNKNVGFIASYKSRAGHYTMPEFVEELRENTFTIEIWAKGTDE